MSKNNNISTRAWVLFTILALSGMTILAKVFVIQTTDKAKWDQKGTQLDKKVMTITPTRGTIYSSDGSILSSTVPRYSLYWDAECEGLDIDDFYDAQDTIIDVLSKMFDDETVESLTKKFNNAINGKKRYAKIIKDLDYDQKNELKRLPILKLNRFKGGFIFNEKSIRQKFFGQLASRTIGSTTPDSLKGIVGLELSYNEELGGREGKQLKLRIPGGEWKPLSEDYIVEPKEGYDLISTIDIHMQDLVHSSLEKSLIANDAEWGCVILMEVETGKIRGISNLSKDEDGNYTEIINHAIQKCSDPGSTFKLPVLMTCLENGLIDITDSIDTEHGSMRVFDKIITDTKNHGKGTVADIFKWSSNVGMAKIAMKCYEKDNQKFLDYLNDLHIGESINTELIGEIKPKLYQSIEDEGWSGISLSQMAIGYEVGQTPLQILTFYNAIANNGKMIKPIFSQELKENNKVIKVFETEVIDEQICSDNTIQLAQDMLELVCNDEEGTAYSVFKKKPYKVAGKTGTNWVYDEETSTYIKGDYRGSFVGYFPAESPKYTCIVVVNKPRGVSYFGSYVAAPVFRDIADMIYASEVTEMAKVIPGESPENRITPVSLNGSVEDLVTLYKEFDIPFESSNNSEWVSISTLKTSVVINPIKTDGMTIPNVEGMALQDAIYILENMGLKVSISGEGVISEQFPEKGKPLANYTDIKLVLE